jgi:hypothetical protein
MQNNDISTIKQKREQLKEISAPFKALKKEGAIETINNGLIKLYTNEAHQNFKSYRGWLAVGYQVKKGEKAFLIWGSPVNYKKTETQGKENQEEEQYFPIAYIFSNAQVEERRNNAN